MLDQDAVGDVEGDVEAFRNELDADERATMVDLCVAATGEEPQLVDHGPEGRYVEGVVRLRRGLSDARARHRIGHELGHLFYERVEYAGADLEERCDLFGAALCMPRRAARAALRSVGHRVHGLAAHFGVTQSVSLLRIGEVTGRPVCLLCFRGPIARGADFAWPSASALVAGLRQGRADVHPVRISDEPNRLGLMVDRGTWLAMSA